MLLVVVTNDNTKFKYWEDNGFRYVCECWSKNIFECENTYVTYDPKSTWRWPFEHQVIPWSKDWSWTGLVEQFCINSQKSPISLELSRIKQN